ncbi:fatty acid-binding protein [Penaeus vannamei]|uniref:Sui m 13 allergen n=1 Tax=Penaeus vannamei TaxID=6689 RepID=A0A423TFI5_PENVA|nr:fatty acid-binding protein-like [Penaeus vannamei]ROT75222.1 Sui m 13 allergen [Penaeus vannamei]
MAQFEGKYKHDRDENFEAFLEKIGTNFVMRKMASKAKPSIEVKIEGDTWTVQVVAAVKTVTMKFKLGEETEIDTQDGKIKVIFGLEGNKLTQRPADTQNSKAVLVEREFTGEGINQKMTHLSSGAVGMRCFVRA